MISLDLARRLQQAGVAWTPSSGDRFVVPDRDLDGLVFAISDMVVEVLDLPSGRVFAFNGTTEWALDSIEQRHVLWLPDEDQLRTLLGADFVSLETTPGGFIVTVEHGGVRTRHVDIEASCAYARAVLDVVSSRPGGGTRSGPQASQ